jgi:hypothetical protein
LSSRRRERRSVEVVRFPHVDLSAVVMDIDRLPSVLIAVILSPDASSAGDAAELATPIVGECHLGEHEEVEEWEEPKEKEHKRGGWLLQASHDR